MHSHKSRTLVVEIQLLTSTGPVEDTTHEIGQDKGYENQLVDLVNGLHKVLNRYTLTSGLFFENNVYESVHFIHIQEVHNPFDSHEPEKFEVQAKTRAIFSLNQEERERGQ